MRQRLPPHDAGVGVPFGVWEVGEAQVERRVLAVSLEAEQRLVCQYLELSRDHLQLIMEFARGPIGEACGKKRRQR